MSYEITGKLIEKYDEVTISDKFRKREFILERKKNTGSFEFIDQIKFQLTQDKCTILDPFQIGDELNVQFDLRGRRWEKDGKVSYFTNLEAWKIGKVESEHHPDISGKLPDDQSPMPDEDPFSSSSDLNDEMDDLPF